MPSSTASVGAKSTWPPSVSSTVQSPSRATTIATPSPVPGPTMVVTPVRGSGPAGPHNGSKCGSPSIATACAIAPKSLTMTDWSMPSAPRLSRSIDQALLVNRMSPPSTGPAKARPSAFGSASGLACAKARQASPKLGKSEVAKVIGSPSRRASRPSMAARAKRALVPPMSATAMVRLMAPHCGRTGAG